MALLLLCLPPHIFWKLLGQRSPWPRIFLGRTARAVGVSIRISGTPLKKDVFFACNHVSWMDILALGGTTGTAFIAHDGIEKWPVIGWLAAQNNTIFVARERRRGVSEQVGVLRAALREHQPVTLFPEGTTGDGVTLLPFKPALFAVMMPPPRDLEVQPVYLDYGREAAEIAWHGDEGAGANAFRMLGRKGRVQLTIHFLEPFDPEGLPDRKAIAAEARKRIEARLQPSLPPFPAV